MLGEKEQAFAYLNKAFEKRQYQMVFMYVEPRFRFVARRSAIR